MGFNNEGERIIEGTKQGEVYRHEEMEEKERTCVCLLNIQGVKNLGFVGEIHMKFRFS